MNLGGGGILKFNLQKVMWCFTAGSSDGRTPLSRTRFDWSVRIISMHDGAQSSLKKWVGSSIIWLRLSLEKSSSSFIPSAFVSPSGYHSWVCPLLSPLKKVEYGFSPKIWSKFGQNLVKNWSKFDQIFFRFNFCVYLRLRHHLQNPRLQKFLNNTSYS